jgi:hypothetical protein
VQLLALVDDQVSVLGLPVTTVAGFAERLTLGGTLGAPAALTVTITDCMAVPPGPLQLSVYVLFAVSVPVDAEPEVGCAPLHAPLAVQAVALVEDHARLLALPAVIVVGLALMLTVGAAITDTVVDCTAVPPGPEQVSVYVLLLLSAAVWKLPEVGCAPLHAPLAVQLVALVDAQLRVLLLLLATLVELALSVTVGAGVLFETVTVTDCDCEVPPVPAHESV